MHGDSMHTLLMQQGWCMCVACSVDSGPVVSSREVGDNEAKHCQESNVSACMVHRRRKVEGWCTRYASTGRVIRDWPGSEGRMVVTREQAMYKEGGRARSWDSGPSEVAFRGGPGSKGAGSECKASWRKRSVRKWAGSRCRCCERQGGMIRKWAA